MKGHKGVYSICRGFLLGLVLLAAFAFVRPAVVQATVVQNGWDATKTHYYVKGVMAKGPTKIKHHWFYFDTKTGKIVKNSFQYIAKKKKTCYYNERGWCVKGEYKVGKYWYYFSKKTCAMQTSGFATITTADGSTKKCYYNAKGRRVKGEKKIGKYWYYFNPETGAMVTDATQLVGNKNKTCYYNAKGRRLNGGSIKTKDGWWMTADEKTGALTQTVICIDAGHQTNANLGQEPIGPGAGTTKYKVTGGAEGVSTGKMEYQLNLEVALKLRKELKSRGMKVVMTRTKNDVNISNSERAKKANAANAAAYIIIHADSDGYASGAHTICNTPSNRFSGKLYPKDRMLAEKVIAAYCKKSGFRSRGVSERDDLSGLNWSKVPTCFIEMGFMSNPSEDVKMANAKNQKKMAEGMADGIEDFLKASGK